MNRPEYWKHLAEEHGDCLRDFMREPAIQPDLAYQQGVIAGHFARLYMEAVGLGFWSLPDLEAPEPGTICPDCGEATEVRGFCGVCHDRKHKPLEAFLSYAVNSCINGRSG